MRAVPDVFDFEDYKSFLKAWAESQARGSWSKIAQATGIHSSSLSQIMNGDKHFNTDHLLLVSDLLNLTSMETDYLLALLMLERAGTENARNHWKKKQGELKERRLNLADRIQPEQKLSEEQKAMFYSSWLYAAVHLCTSIPGLDTRSAIAEKLKIAPDEAERIVAFLISLGLLKNDQSRLQMGTASTYLPRSSPLISRHHQNWRVKAFEHHEKIDARFELSYTCPMTLSRADALRVREMATVLSESAYKLAIPSPAEEMYCLNIDWFRVVS